MPTKRILLDNIRSAHNVGSVFRSADAAGVDKVYLVGPTPTPVDRFGRVQSEIAKTSLGATDSVAWEHIGTPDSESVSDALACIAKLKKAGFTIVAVEQAEGSVSLYDFHLPSRVLYIVGSETDGVHKELLDVSDCILEIPMLGTKESLNVSVASGIVLFAR